MCIHRDRRSDEVRAAKAGPPLCGRPGKWTGADVPRTSAVVPGARRPDHAAGVDRLGRATGPSFGSLLLSRLPRPITVTSGTEFGP